MELIKTLALIVGILIILKLALNNIMNDVVSSDLVPVPGFLDRKEAFDPESESGQLGQLGQLGQSGQLGQLGLNRLSIIASNLPTAKAAGSGAGNCLPVAPNADGAMFDHHANFGDEVTDLAHAFSGDPSLFFNDQRHNAYVPDANKWSEEADIMYQNKTNEKPSTVKEYNYEDNMHNY